MTIKFPDLKSETVFLLFGLTLEGLVCLGSFEDVEEAYYVAASTVGGIVVPGTSLRYLHADPAESEQIGG